MKVWLYYRLSRDEDEELNSLNNQRKIIYNFAVSNGHEVVGESFDDNVSGMHFNARVSTISMKRSRQVKSKPLSSKTCPVLAVTGRRPHSSLTTFVNTMCESCLRRKISTPSTRTTISSSDSKVWSTTSMPEMVAAESAPDTDRNKRKDL